MRILYTTLLLILASLYTSTPSDYIGEPPITLTGIYFDSSMVNSSLRKSPAKSVNNDTITGSYKIKKVNIDQTAELMTIEVSIPAEKEVKFQIACFNMLGKKVLDIQSNKQASSQREFSVDISKIPNGIYICVLQTSSGFRDTEKFIISR